MQVNIKYLAQRHGKKICLLHGKTISQMFLFPCILLHHIWRLEEGLATSATDFKTPNNSTAGVRSLMTSAQTRDIPIAAPSPAMLHSWTPSFILNSICILQTNTESKPKCFRFKSLNNSHHFHRIFPCSFHYAPV